MPNKIDSDLTGLRWAEEASLKVLPGSPVWYPLEPNSYSDFGGQVTTVARNPINANRQRKKGVVVDEDASGGFNMDLTQKNTMGLLPGFFCAAWRKKTEVVGFLTVTTGPNTYTKASGLDAYVVSDIVFAEGFPDTANNGQKDVTAAAAGILTVSQTLVANAVAAPDAKITRVGFTHASATVNVTTVGGYKRYSRASGAKDFTTFGIVPGEFIYVGGTLAANKFVNAGNNGFKRVRAVGTDYIEVDKSVGTMADETGTGLSIKMYFGNCIKNELAGSILEKSYQLERSLSSAGYEYVEGAVANTMQFNIGLADKINMDLGFIACRSVPEVGARSGSRPSIVEADAFNTSSDFARLRMATVADLATPLMAYMTEFSLTIDNGATPVKAVGNVGAIDVSKGDFGVSGSMTALFATIAAMQAVQANTSVTFDFIVQKNNAGIVVDVPYVTLGDGRLNVTKGQPITIPLSKEAAEDPTFHHTLLLNDFLYIPPTS